jgi:hypothetical protein
VPNSRRLETADGLAVLAILRTPGGDESFAVTVDEFEEIGLLLVVDGDIARWPMKKMASTLLKLGSPLPGRWSSWDGRRRCGIGADVGVSEPGFIAEAIDGGQYLRDRLVLGDAIADVGTGEDASASGGASATAAASGLRMGLLGQEGEPAEGGCDQVSLQGGHLQEPEECQLRRAATG